MRTAKQFLETFNGFTAIDSDDSNVIKFTNGIVVEKRIQENTHFAPYLTYHIIIKLDGKVVAHYGTETDQCNLDVIVWFSNKTAESFRNEKKEIQNAKDKYQSLIG